MAMFIVWANHQVAHLKYINLIGFRLWMVNLGIYDYDR